MAKKLHLPEDQIQPLVTDMGNCLATDHVTVKGKPVRFMYREEPWNADDSGWRFLSGNESDDEMEDPTNHGLYPVNTIANLDPSVIPLLQQPVGCAFEKTKGAEAFVPVQPWPPEDDDEEDGEDD
jgi:hypothetical protein